MTDIRQKISGFSWLLFGLFFYFCFANILNPSFKELVLLVIVDFLSLGIVIGFDRIFSTKLYPQYRLIFPKIDKAAIHSLSLEQKVDLIRNGFMKFPASMAIYCLWTSIIKIIPGLCLMLFVWKSDVSGSYRYLFLIGSMVVSFSFFYCYVYIENHLFLSKVLRDLHEENNWADVFSRLSSEHNFTSHVPPKPIQFGQSMAVISMIVSHTALVYLVITSKYEVVNLKTLAFEIILLNLGAFALNARLGYLLQSYVASGLQAIVLSVSRIEPSQSSFIPVHSHPLLASFEMAFNQLVSKLRSYERELVYQIFSRLEKGRFETLGESIALIAHDLSGPLFAIEYCAGQLADGKKLSSAQKSSYLNQLTINSKRSLDLVSSIRSALKEPQDPTSKNVQLFGVIQHSIQLSKIQQFGKGVNRISFRIDEGISSIRIKMSYLDLSHIIVNLISNSVNNLLANSVEFPEIHFDVKNVSEDAIVFTISDNGTGLGWERFEGLTGNSGTIPTREEAKKGLGLRLIRRLIEYSGGTLSVDANPNLGGTTMLVQLPLAEPEAKAEAEAVDSSSPTHFPYGLRHRVDHSRDENPPFS